MWSFGKIWCAIRFKPGKWGMHRTWSNEKGDHNGWFYNSQGFFWYSVHLLFPMRGGGQLLMIMWLVCSLTPRLRQSLKQALGCVISIGWLLLMLNSCFAAQCKHTRRNTDTGVCWLLHVWRQSVLVSCTVCHHVRRQTDIFHINSNTTLCTADNVLLTVAQLWELKYILTYDKLSRQREDK